MIHDQLTFDIDKFITDKVRSARFKGGGSPKQPAKPELSKYGKKAEGITYGFSEQMMEGGMPERLALMQRNLRNEGLEQGFDQAQDSLNSYMARTVNPADRQVYKYMNQQMDDAYYATKDQMRRKEDYQDYMDSEYGLAMATDQLAQAKRMGTSILSTFNQGQAANQAMMAQYGSMSQNVAAGVGDMAGTMLAANKYAKYFNGATT